MTLSLKLQLNLLSNGCFVWFAVIKVQCLSCFPSRSIFRIFSADRKRVETALESCNLPSGRVGRHKTLELPDCYRLLVFTPCAQHFNPPLVLFFLKLTSHSIISPIIIQIIFSILKSESVCRFWLDSLFSGCLPRLAS